MKKLITACALTLAALAATGSSAYARDWDHHGSRGGHYGPRYNHGGHNRFSFNFVSYRTPAPYVAYYRPIVPAPVYVQAPPIVTYANNITDDRYCREYQSTTRVGGRLQPSYGTACLQPDGSWEIVN